MKIRPRARSGITLLEMMAAIMLLAVVGAAAVRMVHEVRIVGDQRWADAIGVYDDWSAEHDPVVVDEAWSIVQGEVRWTVRVIPIEHEPAPDSFVWVWVEVVDDRSAADLRPPVRIRRLMRGSESDDEQDRSAM